jgi:hypothetical protein
MSTRCSSTHRSRPADVTPLTRALLPAALFLVLATSPLSARAGDSDMRKELDELKAEVRALRAEVETLRGGSAATSAATRAPASPEAAAVEPYAPAADAAALSEPATTFWGYGELNYNRPSHDAPAAQADLRRAVLGFGHAFNPTTRVLGELEWEHAVVSAADQGESEVEQLYVEHQFRPLVGGRAGLILIPLGLLNEHHEPANYYGVERNFVETAIIPSTWREGGLSAYGSTPGGLNWSAGVTTGFDLSKWDASSEEGRQSPLGSIHQELQLAKAHDLSFFGTASYQGIPGLTAGGGLFTGGIGQGQRDFAARSARVTIGEAHGRWQSGRLDLSGLYARGVITDTEALNLTFAGSPTPVPSAFWGAYGQAAFRVWDHGQSTITPFLRVEEFNTASSFASSPPGAGIEAAATERVITGGLNYLMFQSVVFKADYQKFRIDSSRDRFNLGVGYQF